MDKESLSIGYQLFSFFYIPDRSLNRPCLKAEECAGLLGLPFTLYTTKVLQMSGIPGIRVESTN